MNYKKVELELPELPPFGTVVEAWGDDDARKHTGVLKGYLHGDPHKYYVDVKGTHVFYRNIRPVPAWTPERGELVACWDSGYGQVRLRAYLRDNRCISETHDDSVSWDFIARIPDGKRIFTKEELTPEWFKTNSEVMEA